MQAELSKRGLVFQSSLTLNDVTQTCSWVAHIIWVHLSNLEEHICILYPLLPIPLHPPSNSKHNMGFWYSSGLRHLWYCTSSCFTIIVPCTCRLCAEGTNNITSHYIHNFWPAMVCLHKWLNIQCLNLCTLYFYCQVVCNV